MSKKQHAAKGAASSKKGGSAKKAFDFPRGNMHTVDPLDLCIDGGKGILCKEESGPLDTPSNKEVAQRDQIRLRRPLTEQFLESVALRGVIVPIVIAKVGDHPVVIAGKSRVRAARRANPGRVKRGAPPIRVPCVVQSDRSQLGMLSTMVLENNLRYEDTLTDKIDKLKQLLDVGSGEDHAARVLGITRDRVSAWLDYDLRATEELRLAVDGGTITASAGLEIARVHDPDRQRATLTKLLGGTTKPSTRGARALVQASGGDQPVSARTRVAQRALLSYLHAPPAGKPLVAEDDAKSWWAGVAAALRLVIGKGDPDPRLTSALKQALEVEDEAEADQVEANEVEDA